MATAEASAVDKAHEEMAMQMYRNFFDSFSQAQGHQPAEQAAQATFVRQLAHAMHLRDLAKSVLP